MARFSGSIKGQRGQASRMGSAASGIHAHVRGWDVGVEVFGDTGDGANVDTFTVYLTAGSNGSAIPKLLGRFTCPDLERSGDDDLERSNRSAYDLASGVLKVTTSEKLKAILGFLLGDKFELQTLSITSDGFLIGYLNRVDHDVLLGTEADLLRNIEGIVDAVGYAPKDRRVALAYLLERVQACRWNAEDTP